MACFSYSYGVVSTYVAIYAKESLGMEAGTGLFFTILCIGLMLSRLIGAHSLRQGAVVKNATHGVIVSLIGYLLFASVHQSWAMYLSALIIGLGNGHMFPAFQTMFINLAENNQRGTANSSILTAWDAGVGLGILCGGFGEKVARYYGKTAMRVFCYGGMKEFLDRVPTEEFFAIYHFTPEDIVSDIEALHL